MATEVRHGRRPRWPKRAAHTSDQNFSAHIYGHYTPTPGLAACGVATVAWVSNRKIKRQAELLAMRTAFICWFVRQYIEHGGSFKQAQSAIQKYPFSKIRRKFRTFGHPQMLSTGA